MEWPEPLKYYYSKKGYPENCVEAANRMLEACKAEYAKETRLIPLSYDEIWREFEGFLEPHTCDLIIKPHIARNANLIQFWFKRILSKHGSPAIPTEDDIRSMLDGFNVNNSMEIAKFIHRRLVESKTFVQQTEKG